MPREMLIWTDGARLAVVREVVAQMADVSVLAVGGPGRGAVSDLAEALGVPGLDDPRQMLVDHPASVLLLGCSTGVRAEDVERAAASGTDVLWLDPPAGVEREVLRQGEGEWGRVACVPAWRMCPAWRSASEPQQVLGGVHSMSLTGMSPAGGPSLYGLLYDAMDLVVHLLGEPDGLEAALTGALVGPPEENEGLTGHLTVHLRFGERASVTLHLSDRAMGWSRRLVVLGEGGRLIMDDGTYELIDAEGGVLDEEGAAEERLGVAGLIARQWGWMAHQVMMPEAVNGEVIGACCSAVLLSCRTGGSESPGVFRQLR